MAKEGSGGGRSWPSVSLLSAFIIVAIIALVWSERERFTTISVGEKAPSFDLPMLGGGRVRLEDLRGKVVFLNIWATWCAPCRMEMPSINRLYDKMRGRPFEVLAVSTDRGGEEEVGPMAERYGYNFPILLDPKGEISWSYRVAGVPETFIIDGDGIISKKIIGPRDWSSLDSIRMIEEVINSSILPRKTTE